MVIQSKAMIRQALFFFETECPLKLKGIRMSKDMMLVEIDQGAYGKPQEYTCQQAGIEFLYLIFALHNKLCIKKRYKNMTLYNERR